MTKQKSTHKTKKMIQTAVWLPHGMHERLKTVSGEEGLGAEIRRRLKNSFDGDPTTRELFDAINEIEGNLDKPWHANRFAFDVFKAAINELLSNYEPSSEATSGADAKLQTKYGPDETPETIGRILARIAFKNSIAKRPLVDT